MFNIEQVDRPGQEEFIWAMRTVIDGNLDNEEWRERRIKTQTYSGVRLTSFAGESLESSESNAKNTSIKMLASFLPDEIINDPNNYNDRISEAAIVVGKIDGLQDLYDTSRKVGKGGASQMTQILNTYISNIMQEAFLYTGDVVRYTGNSFIIVWKQNNQPMADCVHQAIDFSLSIVKNYAYFESEIGVTITVKLSVSAGTLIFSAIGTPNSSLWVITGKPMEENDDMMTKCKMSEVLVSNSAWDYVNSIEYVSHLFDEDTEYYAVTDFSSAWRSIRDVADRTITDAVMNEGVSYTSVTQINIRRDLHDIFESRPCIGDAIKMQTYEELKRFVLPPIVRLIENGEPFENLIEMRHMVILACNYVFEAQSYLDIIKVCDYFYKLIQNIITPYNGYVVKLSFVDNELSFYVLFGIRGETTEFDGRSALRAAIKCFKGSELASSVQVCSMTVVTGLLYCGIVGHGLRREFVVVGPAMSKARKLYQEFTNKVTCDRETFLQSKLEPRNFMLQEFKQGAAQLDVGPVYEYLEFDTSSRLPKYFLDKNPILDRDYEIQTFHKVLQACTKNFITMELQNYQLKYAPWGLFYFGVARVGKTRLIDELISLTPKLIPMFRIRLSRLDKNMPYQTIYYIFGVPLGIAENSTIADREAKLRSKLKKMPIDGIECLLNVVFRVNFPMNVLFNSMKAKEKVLILQSLIKHLCRICFSKVWVIFIDGGEYIDNESWDLIYSILESTTIVLVAAIGDIEPVPENAKQYLSRTKCRCIQMLPLDKLYYSSMVCQVLNCIAIPIELEKYDLPPYFSTLLYCIYSDTF